MFALQQISGPVTEPFLVNEPVMKVSKSTEQVVEEFLLPAFDLPPGLGKPILYLIQTQCLIEVEPQNFCDR